MFKSIKPDLPLAKSGWNNRFKMRPFIAHTTTSLRQTPAKIEPVALIWAILVFDLIVGLKWEGKDSQKSSLNACKVHLGI